MEMMRYGLVALMAMGAFLAWVALRVNAEEVGDDNEPLVDVPDQVQMCPPTVTSFVPGQSVTVGKCHYSHAYLLKERPFGTS